MSGSHPLAVVETVITDTGEHCRGRFLGFYETVFLALYKLQLFPWWLYCEAFVWKGPAPLPHTALFTAGLLRLF